MDDAESSNGCDEQKLPGLARQSLVYSLTFDEVQIQLGDVGKPLNCMNVDELVRNVKSVEEQPIPSSSFSNPLREKTVDEVWKEIGSHQDQQQLTVGETRMEDFLLRAGVINQDFSIGSESLLSIDPMFVTSSHQADRLQYEISNVHHHQHQHPQQQQQCLDMLITSDQNFEVSGSVYDNSVSNGVGYTEEREIMRSTPLMTSASVSETNVPSSEAEMMEKAIERRHKRIIKNRESAARSRARRQAYANQLEHDVFGLRKTNRRLKKQKELETMTLPSEESSGLKYQLRRTSSARI